jgi:hypothetical protein
LIVYNLRWRLRLFLIIFTLLLVLLALLRRLLTAGSQCSHLPLLHPLLLVAVPLLFL